MLIDRKAERRFLTCCFKTRYNVLENDVYDMAWSLLHPDLFMSEALVSVCEYLISFERDYGRKPTPQDAQLNTVPAYQEELLDVLHSNDVCHSPAELESLHHYLTELNTKRNIKRSLHYADTQLVTNGATSSEVAQFLAETAEKAVSTSLHSTEKDEFSFGTKSHFVNDLKAMLDPNRKPSFIKTGLDCYDDAIGGFPEYGVVLLGGTTSAGKSVMANQLLLNMPFNVENTTFLKSSLELTKEQELYRVAASLAGINLQQIKMNTLTDIQRKVINDTLHLYSKDVAELNNNIRFWSPQATGGINMGDFLRRCRVANAKVSVLDYVGLLNDVDVDKQAIALSSAVRQAKIYANATASLIIILVQVDSEKHVIRYSRAMLEHADVFWRWNPTPAEKSAGSWFIYQEKGRDSPIGKFQVELESGLMRFKTVGDFIVGDITDSVVVNESEAPNVGKTPSVGNF